MYIVIYFVVLGITTFVINKINDVEPSDEFLKWNKRELIIIGILFLIAVVLQCIDVLLPMFCWAIFAFFATIVLVYANKNREQDMQEYKKQIEQIYDSIDPLTPRDEEVRYNDLPFRIKKEDTKINEIIVDHQNPSKHNDTNCTNVVYSLKNYFPYYDWQYSIDHPKQITTFIGQKLPPQIALWNGSDWRNSDFIPVGLGGAGEVGLKLANKEPGQSSYVYEDGKIPGTVDLPSAPQYLVVGSTGGGKAIDVDQHLW